MNPSAPHPRPPDPAPALRRLARALRQPRPACTTHASCHAALDAYTDAELAGTLTAWTHTRTHQHLLVCANCATQYANLLQKKLNARHLEN